MFLLLNPSLRSVFLQKSVFHLQTLLSSLVLYQTGNCLLPHFSWPYLLSHLQNKLLYPGIPEVPEVPVLYPVSDRVHPSLALPLPEIPSHVLLLLPRFLLQAKQSPVVLLLLLLEPLLVRRSKQLYLFLDLFTLYFLFYFSSFCSSSSSARTSSCSTIEATVSVS